MICRYLKIFFRRILNFVSYGVFTFWFYGKPFVRIWLKILALSQSQRFILLKPLTEKHIYIFTLFNNNIFSLYVIFVNQLVYIFPIDKFLITIYFRSYSCFADKLFKMSCLIILFSIDYFLGTEFSNPFTSLFHIYGTIRFFDIYFVHIRSHVIFSSQNFFGRKTLASFYFAGRNWTSLCRHLWIQFLRFQAKILVQLSIFAQSQKWTHFLFLSTRTLQ